MPNNNTMPIDLTQSKLPHLFADEIAVATQLKARPLPTGKFEKEGQIVLFFMDGMKRQFIGEYVISRATAKDLVAALTQTITALEKELASDAAPQQPQVKTTATSGDTAYR